MKKYWLLALFTMLCIESFAQFYIGSGATFVMRDNTQLTLENQNLINNADFVMNTGNGKVSFTGSNNNSISGTGSILRFDNLEINKPAGTLQLARNIRAIGNVYFTIGLIDLNNKTFWLSGTTSKLVNETEASRIMSSTPGGYVYIQRDIPANTVDLNHGNLGAIVTTGATAMGSTEIRRYHDVEQSANTTSSSIKRTFYINPVNNSALGATLKFTYFDAELNGLTESDLAFWKSENRSAWTSQGFSQRDAAANYVSLAGINDFSYWTLSTAATALPITLISFTGEAKACSADLHWKSASEINFSHFEIETSKDGITFTKIAEVSAKGFGYSYSFRVADAKAYSFYRLKMVDITGQFAYSNILKLTVDCNKRDLQATPNPAATYSVISGLHYGEVIAVYNAGGQLMLKEKADGNQLTLSTKWWSKGLYLIHVKDAEGKQVAVLRLIKGE